jgi:hypothetical protein
MRARRDSRGVWCALLLAAHGCSDGSAHRPGQADTRRAGADGLTPTLETAPTPEHPATPGLDAATAPDDAASAARDANATDMSASPSAAQNDPTVSPASGSSVAPPVLPAVSVPVRLGTLAGHDMPHAQANLHFYGTDTGSSYEHKGKLWMLFGDTWPTSDFICVNTRPLTDDSIALFRPPPFSWTSPMRQDASGKHVEET